MPTSYTSLLGLALPVTGELSGTWGDTVNNYITSFLDASVAGTQTISGSQTAVTLSVTNGSSLVTAGSGATGSAQFQIINCTGNPAGVLTITAPASSRQYIIINGTSTSQSVKIVGAGPTTGITLVAGEKAHVAWNGSDFVKIATQSGSGTFTTVTTTNLEVSNIKANDGTAAATVTNGTGVITVSTQLNVDNLRLDGNTLSSTDSNGNIVIAPNGTGDVQLDADTVRIGDSAAAVTLTSNGAGALTVTTGGAADLVLNTNSGTNSGSITIGNGTNGNITVAPNGTGDFYVDADTMRLGDSNANATITTNGTGDLILNTNSGTNSGSITIQDGVDGNIIIAPNGNGQVQISNAALDLTTIEVTNIKAKDGTASITLADSTGVASFTANPILSGGTANGVLYLNASNVATSGSALTFDGSQLGVGTASGTSNGLKLNSGNAGANYVLYRDSTTGLLQVYGNQSGFNGLLVSGIDGQQYLSDPAKHIWSVSNSEQMRLTSTGLKSSIAGSNSDPVFSYTSDTNTGIFFPAADKLGFVAGGGSDQMVLTTTGLGIGVDPGVKLDVVGQGRLVYNTGATNTGDQSVVTVGATTTGAYASSYGAGLQFQVVNSSGGYAGSRIVSRLGADNNTANLVFQARNYGFADSMTIDANGGLIVKPVATGHAVFNEDGVDADFRVEGDTDTHLIFADASTDRVGIGTNGPGAKLTVKPNTAVLNVTSGRLDATNNVRLEAAGTASTYLEYRGYLGHIWDIDTTERMRLDSSGNLGLGVTPSAWSLSGLAVFQVKNGAVAGFGNEVSVSANKYYNAGDKYIATDFATQYNQKNGQHQWFTAASGTAGTAITFTQALTLTAVSNLKLGGTADRATTVGTNHLDIFNGTAPVGTLTNGISLYSAAGEAYVMDAAGNATLFSPHDRETNEWIFRSKHTPTGKVLKIDVEKLLRFINDHFGLDAVHEFIEE